eukprot:TRINITY_DN9434_c0_g1_i1.p1 TRINITY_DN9434_c0_g1~~TRINITY_DN9434_c0_g1_i1.p1  ORF type:complete len:462 (-),score=78.75 TRINITY_DN9434_c0_g1_i1:425-1810(-)
MLAMLSTRFHGALRRVQCDQQPHPNGIMHTVTSSNVSVTLRRRAPFLSRVCPLVNRAIPRQQLRHHDQYHQTQQRRSHYHHGFECHLRGYGVTQCTPSIRQDTASFSTRGNITQGLYDDVGKGGNMEEKQLYFDREVKRQQKNNVAATGAYKDNSYLHDEIAKRVLDRVLDVLDRKFPVVLDLGSYLMGNNYNQLVRATGAETVIRLGMSEKLLYSDADRDHATGTTTTGDGGGDKSIGNPHSYVDTGGEDMAHNLINPVRILGDEEWIPVPDKSVDLIVANLSLHWVNDLPNVFKQVKRALKPDGLFLAAVFSEKTLNELRESFLLAEEERDGGVSVHVSPFMTIGDGGNLLTQSGFTLTTADTESVTINYANPFVLMNELQGMGENNASVKRRGSLSRDTIYAAAATYQALHGNEDGSVPATFHITYLTGWSPSEKQPKPLPRGSSSVSLEDFGTPKSL